MCLKQFFENLSTLMAHLEVIPVKAFYSNLTKFPARSIIAFQSSLTKNGTQMFKQAFVHGHSIYPHEGTHG